MSWLASWDSLSQTSREIIAMFVTFLSVVGTILTLAAISIRRARWPRK